MVRTIELENNGARNLYAEMLKTIVSLGYPQGWPIDILVDFETITEEKLYNEGKSFIWIIRDHGTHLYHEDYIRDHECLKMVLTDNNVIKVYLVTMGKYERVNMVEIEKSFPNVYNAYCTLPRHVYPKNNES